MSDSTLREALEQLIACHNEPECPAIAVARAALAADDAARGAMREQFEAHMRTVWTPGYAFPKAPSGDYMHGEMQRFWLLWQAASRAAAPQSVEPVAWGQLGMLNGRSYLRQNYDRTPYPPPPDVARNLNLVPLFAAPPLAPTDAEWQEEAMRLADDYAMRMVGISVGDAPERAKEGREALRAHIATRPLPAPPTKKENGA